MFESRDPTVTNAAPYPRLLGDIGGTNARFGWQTQEGADISHVQVLPCADHASAERVLSGAGLVDLYHALCEIKGDQGEQSCDITTPAEVLARAQDAPLSTADEALDMFCGFLGSVAGDLALTLGARGGIYIGGGIVPRLGARFQASPFRPRFEDKGRFQNYLNAIPVWVIHSPVSPALLGASQALSLKS